MDKDQPNSQKEQPIIKTWQQFEERVLALNRKDWKADPQKFKDEMEAIRKAYYQGADGEGKKWIRGMQIRKLNLTDHPAVFSFSEEHMKERLAKTKEMWPGRTYAEKVEQRKPPKPAKKLDSKKEQVTTDRVFNLLYNDPERGVRIVGNFNYRVKWIHDTFTHILKKEYVDKAPRLKEAIFKPEDKDLFLKRIDEFRSYIPQLKFTDAQFRKITGLKKITGEEINQLVESYRKLDIKGEIFSYWDEEVNRWIKASFSGSIADVLTLETGRISPRGSKPEHEYYFSLNAGGFLLFHNLLNRRYTVFPKRFYRQLKGGAQDIYRYVAQFNVSDLSIQTISKILGYGETKYIYKRMKRIDSYLNELKEQNLIKNWAKKGRGQKVVYHINRI